MYLAMHKQWMFGSFLIFANSLFTARRAYAILAQQQDCEQRTGTLILDTGERVQWTNSALPYRRQPDAQVFGGPR
ncbi:hypothetical protein Q8A64_08410 [Oxalobacteraceae bacterium R-40]|uniref:Secreted protein n=1 Tax=Keguizhuia sedimenti TaxID=3064264 RepID=A0ABU1BN46_9BURK|nr:hypothetical protein [Oxalobacteraceae bacterium R-40]